MSCPSHLLNCRVLPPGEFNDMSSQSHVSRCRVGLLPLGEFTVMIPEPDATLQGVRIQWRRQNFFCGGDRSLSPSFPFSSLFPLLPFPSSPLSLPPSPPPPCPAPHRPVARIVKTRRQTGQAPPPLPCPPLPCPRPFPSLPLPLEVGPLKSS